VRHIRYKRNPLPNRNARFGRKVMDEVTGFWTYEGLTVINQQGYRIDPRRGGYDLPENLTDAKQTGRRGR
jgi:hypothetical protein